MDSWEYLRWMVWGSGWKLNSPQVRKTYQSLLTDCGGLKLARGENFLNDGEYFNSCGKFLITKLSDTAYETHCT